MIEGLSRRMERFERARHAIDEALRSGRCSAQRSLRKNRLAFAAERALDLVGHSALPAKSSNRYLPVSVTLLLCRCVHDCDLIQITSSIGGTSFSVETPILTFLDGSLW